MKKFLPILALLSITLTACSTVNSGTIVEKDYDEPYTTMYMICGSYDSKGLCTSYIPQYIESDEAFSFKLKNGDEFGWVSVSENTYNAHQLGDYVNFDK